MTTAPTRATDILPDREVCGLVNELNQVIETHLRHGAQHLQLTPSQALALRELGKPITLRELARRMCCEPSNASYVADRLVGLKWVRRDEHPTDRRAKILTLTSEGEAKRAQLLSRLSDGSPLSNLSRDEISHLKVLLQKACG